MHGFLIHIIEYKQHPCITTAIPYFHAWFKESSTTPSINIPIHRTYDNSTHNPIYRFKSPRRSRQSKRNTEMHRNTSKLYRHNFASTNISYLLAIQPDDQKSNQPYPFPFTPPHSPHSIPFFHHFHSFQSLHIIFSYRFTPNPLPTQPDLKPINQPTNQPINQSIEPSSSNHSFELLNLIPIAFFANLNTR